MADVEDLPTPDETFDAVLSNIVLFHVTDPEKAMSEARRVLNASTLTMYCSEIEKVERNSNKPKRVKMKLKHSTLVARR